MFEETFAGHRKEAGRFSQAVLPPGKALSELVRALRRGDAATVLIGAPGAERRALLQGVRSLIGPGQRIQTLSGLASAQCISAQLTACEHAAAAAPKGARRAVEPSLAAELVMRSDTIADQDSGDRAVLIVEDADKLPPEVLSRLGALTRHGHGMVQVLLCGNSMLLARLCEPACADIWRRVRLALTLAEHTRIPEPTLGSEPATTLPTSIEALKAEIARTEARLAALRRTLAIFNNEVEPLGF